MDAASIPMVRAGWDCEAAGLEFDSGDEARVTIEGRRQ
jgi:hypothetical protein